MRTKRVKRYTDYSYVTRNELRSILNISGDAVGYLLQHGMVLATVIGARKKYILGHVRKAQEALAAEQNQQLLDVLARVAPSAKRQYRKVQ